MVVLELSQALQRMNGGNEYLWYLGTAKSGGALDLEGERSLARGIVSYLRLECLNISGHNLGEAEVQTLVEDIGQNAGIRRMVICECNLDDRAAHHLLSAVEQLEDLMLGGNRLREPITLIKGLRKCRSLRHLNLCNNQMGDAAVSKLLAVVSHIPSIQVLELGGNLLTDQIATSLETFVTNNISLRRLGLEENFLADRATCAVAKSLRRNRTLQTICLHGNQISCRGAVDLAESLQCNHILRELLLQGNNIGHAGARALLKALDWNATLERLLLHCNVEVEGDIYRQIQTVAAANARRERDCIVRRRRFDRDLDQTWSQRWLPGSSTAKILPDFCVSVNRLEQEHAQSLLYYFLRHYAVPVLGQI